MKLFFSILSMVFPITLIAQQGQNIQLKQLSSMEMPLKNTDIVVKRTDNEFVFYSDDENELLFTDSLFQPLKKKLLDKHFADFKNKNVNCSYAERMVYTKNHYIVFVTLHEKLSLYWYDLQGNFLFKQQIKDKEKQISKTIFVSTLFPNMVMEKSDTLYICNHLLSKDTSVKQFYLNKIKIGKSEKLMTYFPATPTNICQQQIHVNEVKIVGDYFVFRNIFSSSFKFLDANLHEVAQFSEKDSEIKCPDTDSLFLQKLLMKNRNYWSYFHLVGEIYFEPYSVGKENIPEGQDSKKMRLFTFQNGKISKIGELDFVLQPIELKDKTLLALKDGKLVKYQMNILQN